MDYITVQDAAKKWQISDRMVRRYCSEGKVFRARQQEGIWLIPANAHKPTSISKTDGLTSLAKKIIYQQTRNNHNGVYEYIQVNMAYSSNRMASNRLTRGQVEQLYRTGRISAGFEPTKVEDLIESRNHFMCVDQVIDNITNPLTQAFIKRLHGTLMSGVMSDHQRPGDYRAPIVRIKNREVIPADKIKRNLAVLIDEYEEMPTVDRSVILDFHVRFEQIMPFADGNGRVGRLIMLKECLRHDVMPFILDDKRRSRYLKGIREWGHNTDELIDVVLEAQNRFEGYLELQRLMSHGRKEV